MAEPVIKDTSRLEELLNAVVVLPKTTTATIEEIVINSVSFSNSGLHTEDIRRMVANSHPMVLWMVNDGISYLLDNGYVVISDRGIINLTDSMQDAKRARIRHEAFEEMARRIVVPKPSMFESREIRTIRYILERDPNGILEPILLSKLNYSMSEFIHFRRFMDHLIDIGLVLRSKSGNEEVYRLSTDFHVRIRRLQHEKAQQAANELTPVSPGSLYASSIPPINPHLFEATIKVKGVELDIIELKNLYNLAKKHTEDPNKHGRSLASSIGYRLEHNEIMALYAHLKKLGLFEPTN